MTLDLNKVLEAARSSKAEREAEEREVQRDYSEFKRQAHEKVKFMAIFISKSIPHDLSIKGEISDSYILSDGVAAYSFCVSENDGEVFRGVIEINSERKFTMMGMPPDDESTDIYNGKFRDFQDLTEDSALAFIGDLITKYMS